jgi:NAD(P)-dependent dehydrogenase (short-subunit alcohol dehydrogenase family)
VSIMKFDFAGQVVIITGAAGNLGAAVANAFRGAGAKLALIDRTRALPRWLLIKPNSASGVLIFS